MRRLLYLAPVLTFVLLVVFFVGRLALIEQGNAPNFIPSVLIGKPVPDFNLPSLDGKKPKVTAQAFKGRVVLISFFSSWCQPCRAEHPYLSEIAQSGIDLIGINYKDEPSAARNWLEKLGNPYSEIGVDADGRAGIDFGVYGVPETYLIDKSGVIRFKQTGPLSPEIIRNTLLPMAKELNK